MRKRHSITVAIGLVGMVGITALAIAQTANRRAPAILGAWNVAVTKDQVTFPALLTFISDGIVIADESPGPFESSGHGNWSRNGDGQIAYTFVALFGSQDHAHTGKLKVVGTLQFDAAKAGWRGPFRIDFIDEAGKTGSSGRGTAALTRLAIESLE